MGVGRLRAERSLGLAGWVSFPLVSQQHRLSLLRQQMGHGVRLWLEAMRLETHVVAFLENGFDDLDVISQMTDEVHSMSDTT
jgi:hypothetical protein